MGLGKSLFDFFRGILYPLSRIPGLGFLYNVDRHVSMGASVASSAKTLKDDVKQNKDKKKDQKKDEE